MYLGVLLYRAKSWVRHLLTARNTGGHGIHSPYLFELVRMILHDKNSYYAWEKIESVREQLLHDEREIAYVDYGSGAKVSGEMSKRRVCDVAQNSLETKKYAQILARLVGWLGNETSARKGLYIVELGTSLGVTTAYMASMDSRNRVVTFEGCPAVAEMAKANWDALEISNIACQLGKITADSLQKIERVDLAFIDANHTHEGTREYFHVLAEKTHEKSVIVIDDIHYNAEMEKAWRAICDDARVSSTIDLYQMGMVFFDKHYWKRNYKIRL